MDVGTISTQTPKTEQHGTYVSTVQTPPTTEDSTVRVTVKQRQYLYQSTTAYYTEIPVHLEYPPCSGIAVNSLTENQSTNESPERRYFFGNSSEMHTSNRCFYVKVTPAIKIKPQAVGGVPFLRKVTPKQESFIEGQSSSRAQTRTSCALVCRDQCSVSSGINSHTLLFAHNDARLVLRVSPHLPLLFIRCTVNHTCPTFQIGKQK